MTDMKQKNALLLILLILFCSMKKINFLVWEYSLHSCSLRNICSISDGFFRCRRSDDYKSNLRQDQKQKQDQYPIKHILSFHILSEAKEKTKSM